MIPDFSNAVIAVCGVAVACAVVGGALTVIAIAFVRSMSGG